MLNFELCFDNNKLNTSLSDLKSERVTFDMLWGSYRKPVPPKDTGTMKWGILLHGTGILKYEGNL